MRLLLADSHLHRALFRDKEELKRARALIEHCGYWRRKQELEDAEEAACPGKRERVRSRASVLDCASPLALLERGQAPVCALIFFTHAARKRRRTAAIQDASRFTTPVAVLARADFDEAQQIAERGPNAKAQRRRDAMGANSSLCTVASLRRCVDWWLSRGPRFSRFALRCILSLLTSAATPLPRPPIPRQRRTETRPRPHRAMRLLAPQTRN